MPLTIVHQRGNQDFGTVVDAFDFELHEFVGALAQGFGSANALFFHQRLNLATQGPVADANETPRLHQADTGRLVGGL